MNKCGICGLEHERAEFAAATVCTDALLEELDAAKLRERAALEQASRARKSVAELTARLETLGSNYIAISTALTDMTNRAGDEFERAEAAEARAKELEAALSFYEDSAGSAARHSVEDLERDIEFEKRETLAATTERNAAQAQVEQLQSKMREIAAEAREASGRNDDCIDFTCALPYDIDTALSAAPADTAHAEYVKALEAEHELLASANKLQAAQATMRLKDTSNAEYYADRIFNYMTQLMESYAAVEAAKTKGAEMIDEAKRAAFRAGAKAMRAALITDAQRLGVGVTERFLRDSVLPEMKL